MANLASTFQYSLYWSGRTPSSHVVGQSNNSFLSVWEAGNFAITATRVQEFNIPSLTNPPSQPGRFDGRLRSVSIYFKYNENDKVIIVGAGVIAPQITRGEAGHLLKSHKPLSSTKPGSFWAIEEAQYGNSTCFDNSKYLPGCLNPTDQPDNSFLTITFPIGVESRSHGLYSDGIFSVLVTRFRGDWDDYPDYNTTHQNFVLLIVRMLNGSLLFRHF